MNGLGDIQDALADIIKKADEHDRIAIADALKAHKKFAPTDHTVLSRQPIFHAIVDGLAK